MATAISQTNRPSASAVPPETLNAHISAYRLAGMKLLFAGMNRSSAAALRSLMNDCCSLPGLPGDHHNPDFTVCFRYGDRPSLLHDAANFPVPGGRCYESSPGLVLSIHDSLLWVAPAPL